MDKIHPLVTSVTQNSRDAHSWPICHSNLLEYILSINIIMIEAQMKLSKRWLAKQDLYSNIT